jgi:hypothetical protein
MRLADKRFRGPDREPWDPQRALTLGLRAETFAASHTGRPLVGYPFHLRHRDGQVHVLGARVDVRGDALPATPRIYLAHDTKERLAPFPIGLRAKVHDPGHLEWFCIADKDGGRARATGRQQGSGTHDVLGHPASGGRRDNSSYRVGRASLPPSQSIWHSPLTAHVQTPIHRSAGAPLRRDILPASSSSHYGHSVPL